MSLLFLLFGVALAVQAAYWWLLARGVAHARQHDPYDPSQSPRSGDALPPLSVIVAARDEAAALPTLLAALARQSHPRFEVIVADDGSTDHTARLAQRGIDSLPEGVTGRVVRVEDPAPPRKKNALTQAIAAARHERLAFTDADCVPPPGWLAALAHAHATFEEKHGEETGPLLLGYSPYRHARPGNAALLTRFARYETFLAGALAAGACGLGRPYMGVGRNLSYTKTLFDEIGGFAHSQDSMSGDDDLLVQEVHRRRAAPVRHVFGPATYVATEAPRSWRAWLHQKRRHASAGRFYDAFAGAHLTAFNLTGVLLWLAPLTLGGAGLALLAAKLLIQYVALRPAAHAFEETDLLTALPLWDLGYAAYNVLVVPLGLARLPDTWR